MKTIKSITILEAAMETVNQMLQEAAHSGDLNAVEKLSGIVTKMAEAVTGLCSANGMADSMEKLHELAMNIESKKNARFEPVNMMSAPPGMD